MHIQTDRHTSRQTVVLMIIVIVLMIIIIFFLCACRWIKHPAWILLLSLVARPHAGLEAQQAAGQIFALACWATALASGAQS